MPFAEHLGLVGTCGLLQQAKAHVADLQKLTAECLAVLEQISLISQLEDGK